MHSEISGTDFTEMERILRESETLAEGKQGPVQYITTSLDEGTPELEVEIVRFKTSYYGVTVECVVNQVRGFLQALHREFRKGRRT